MKIFQTAFFILYLILVFQLNLSYSARSKVSSSSKKESNKASSGSDTASDNLNESSDLSGKISSQKSSSSSKLLSQSKASKQNQKSNQASKSSDSSELEGDGDLPSEILMSEPDASKSSSSRESTKSSQKESNSIESNKASNTASKKSSSSSKGSKQSQRSNQASRSSEIPEGGDESSSEEIMSDSSDARESKSSSFRGSKNSSKQPNESPSSRGSKKSSQRSRESSSSRESKQSSQRASDSSSSRGSKQSSQMQSNPTTNRPPYQTTNRPSSDSINLNAIEKFDDKNYILEKFNLDRVKENVDQDFRKRESILYERTFDSYRHYNTTLDKYLIYSFFVDGSKYVIFDCDNPSYIDRDNRKVILKNHFLNIEVERRKTPFYNGTQHVFKCKNDKTSLNDGLWSLAYGWHSVGLFGFDDKKIYDNTKFYLLVDDHGLRAFFKKLIDNNYQQSHSSSGMSSVGLDRPEMIENLITNTLKLTHNPKYHQPSNANPIYLDIIEEVNSYISVELRESREKKRAELREMLMKNIKNLNIDPKANLLDPYLSDGFSFIVFNCTKPQFGYQLTNNKPYTIEMVYLTEAIKELGKCNKQENVWREKLSVNNHNPYITINFKNKGILNWPPPKLIEPLKTNPQLCSDLMKFMNHPYFYDNKLYNKLNCF